MTRQKSCRPSSRRSRRSVKLAYLPGLAGLARGGGFFVLVGRALPLRLGGRLVLRLLFATGLTGLLDDLLEGADRLVEVDEFAFEAGELLGDEERLGEEALEAPGPADDDLVLLRELVYAEDGDDVLQLLVALQDVLDLLGHLVVLVAEHTRVEECRRRAERVDRWIDALGREGPREFDRRVEVGEHRERRGVGKVVGRHVDGLEARDRPFLRRGNALLERTHFCSQGRLVADLRGHASHEGRDLVTRLDEAEDVIDEEEHVLAKLLAEVLGQGDAGEPDAETGAGRLVHLSEDEPHVREDSCLLELAVEVVPLAGALANAGEDRRALVLKGYVVDQLLNDDRLSYAGAAEEADLAAPAHGAQQVYDLDAR